jgi:hypothetical protein
VILRLCSDPHGAKSPRLRERRELRGRAA